MSRFFRVAPFDATTFVVTIVFVLALGYFAVRTVLDFANNQPIDTFNSGAMVLLAVIMGWSLVRSVRGYRLGNGTLLIERLGPGKIGIPLADIENAEPRTDLGNFVRAGFLSMQGLFGWTGKVNVRKPTDIESQRMEVYGTNPANTVLLQLKEDRRVIVTPRDIDGFVTALRESGVGAAVPRRAKSSYMPARKKKKK